MNFWYEKFIMRFSYIFAVVAFVWILIYAFNLEVRRDEERANLAFQQNLIADLGQDGLQSIPLDKPHRADRELKGWIGAAVSESLSIDPLAFNKLKNDIKIYFTDSGLQQYEGYLTRSGLLEDLRVRNNRMNVFLEDQPLLLTASEVNGIYRWLYQVPMTLSFLPRNSNNAVQNLANRKISLRVQIRRTPASDSPNEMQIESWNVSMRR